LFAHAKYRGERIGANFAFCGADPSAQHSQHGRTALHTAVMTDDVELVKVSKPDSWLEWLNIHQYSISCWNLKYVPFVSDVN